MRDPQELRIAGAARFGYGIGLMAAWGSEAAGIRLGWLWGASAALILAWALAEFVVAEIRSEPTP